MRGSFLPDARDLTPIARLNLRRRVLEDAEELDARLPISVRISGKSEHRAVPISSPTTSARSGPCASAKRSITAAAIVPTKLRLVWLRAAPMMKSAVRSRSMVAGQSCFLLSPRVRPCPADESLQGFEDGRAVSVPLIRFGHAAICRSSPASSRNPGPSTAPRALRILVRRSHRKNPTTLRWCKAWRMTAKRCDLQINTEHRAHALSDPAMIASGIDRDEVARAVIRNLSQTIGRSAGLRASSIRRVKMLKCSPG